MTMASADAKRLLDLLNPSCDGLIELRVIRRGTRPLQEFHPAGDLDAAATRAVELRERGDVYFGVAPRARKEGTKDAISMMPALWADLDDDASKVAMSEFGVPPTAVVRSGRGLHAYWVLDQAMDVARAESFLRRIAAALGADERATDASRVLRVPGTLNHKSAPPLEVELASHDGPRASVGELDRLLPDDPQAGVREPRHPRPDAPSGAIERVLERLDGARPSGSGWTAHCPAHADENPSLSVAKGEDGRCLLHCFAGCAVEDVVSAVGLEMKDLLPYAGAPGSPSVPAQLVDLANQEDVFLFHDELDQAFAWVPRDGHREVWKVTSKKFRRWLRGQFFNDTHRVATSQAVSDAVELLCARAEFEGPVLEVFVRIAGQEDSVFIDLADERWRAIEVNAGDWTIRDDPPVPFLRRGSTLALPEPERGGTLEELRSFLNLPDEHAWRLLVAFLVMCLQDQGPYPILILLGEQGSAKSTAARLLRRLLDPVKAPLRAGSPSERDLMIMAARSWIIGFDNVRQVSDRLSDALCQLSTGAGFGLRELYTDDEEVIFEAMRPAILNGIAGIAERPDLISRSIVTTLPGINDEDREAEKDFWARFDEAWPRIMGALLDLLAKVLARRSEVDLQGAPRMADFARVGVAVEQALGWPAGAFLDAFGESQGSALTATLDSDPVSSVVQSYLDTSGDFSGSATELLAELSAHADEKIARQRNWPANAAQLAKRLKALAPALRKVGVEVADTHSGRGQSKRRGLLVRKIGDGGDGGDG
jgi:hypothetical protein